MATTLKNNANRLNMVGPLPTPASYGLKSGIFKRAKPVSISAEYTLECTFSRILFAKPVSTFAEYALAPESGEEPAFMQHEPPAAEFDIEEARRVLGDVFAPW